MPFKSMSTDHPPLGPQKIDTDDTGNKILRPSLPEVLLKNEYHYGDLKKSTARLNPKRKGYVLV